MPMYSIGNLLVCTYHLEKYEVLIYEGVSKHFMREAFQL